MSAARETTQFVLQMHPHDVHGTVFLPEIREVPLPVDEILDCGTDPDFPPSGIWWRHERRGDREFSCNDSPWSRRAIVETFGPAAELYLKPAQEVALVTFELAFDVADRAFGPGGPWCLRSEAPNANAQKAS